MILKIKLNKTGLQTLHFANEAEWDAWKEQFVLDVDCFEDGDANPVDLEPTSFPATMILNRRAVIDHDGLGIDEFINIWLYDGEYELIES